MKVEVDSGTAPINGTSPHILLYFLIEDGLCVDL